MGTAAVLADANEVSLGVVDAAAANAFFFFLLFLVPPPLLTEALFNNDDVCGGATVDITAVVVDVDSILVLLPVPALMELPLDTAGINFLPLFAVVFDSAVCSPLVAVGEGISLDRRDTVVGAILPAVDPCTLFF